VNAAGQVYIDTSGLEITAEVGCTRLMDTVRIGCGCGFWGDSAAGPAQLVRMGGIDVLMLDYLSEITMSLLARARRKRPELGYATDFVTAVMAPLAREIAERRIRVVTNAGGVNPSGCALALLAVLEQLGVRLSIATVIGDDVTGELAQLREAGATDLETGGALPEKVVSANAYLGAFPIAQALRNGADVVITGRCADSALALGPLIAAFDWQPSDLDRLAMGSLAGHIIECGTQATGGIFTDWRPVAAAWDDMGYPVVECSADGSFIVTKPKATGGLVIPATIAEQITYEVHDPAAYILPDVVCDFTDVQLEALGTDRVRVTGARGLPATPDYKASLTYDDGFRCMATLMIVGLEAVMKAHAVAAAILARAARLLAQAGHSRFSATSVEVLGSESLYGPHGKAASAREVVLKIAVAHADEAALELFSREIFPAATSMAQGITGFAAGRPAVQPVVRLASCLVAKSRVPLQIEVDGRVIPYGCVTATADSGTHAYGRLEKRPAVHNGPAQTGQPSLAIGIVAGGYAPRAKVPRAKGATFARGASAACADGTMQVGHAAGVRAQSAANFDIRGPAVEVPLIRLAWGRSGDKGDTANIGVIARRREFMPAIGAALTPQSVAAYLAHLVAGPVQRFDWPGLHGWNFVLRRALGGGGIASLRYDPQGKSYAQILMDFPVRVPAEWTVPGGLVDVADSGAAHPRC
jgi:hypothetical protein